MTPMLLNVLHVLRVRAHDDDDVPISSRPALLVLSLRASCVPYYHQSSYNRDNDRIHHRECSLESIRNLQEERENTEQELSNKFEQQCNDAIGIATDIS